MARSATSASRTGGPHLRTRRPVRRAGAIANLVAERVTGTRTAQGSDRLVHASAFDLYLTATSR